MFLQKVEKILFVSGRYVDEITDTFCGSICAISGLHSYITGVATITEGLSEIELNRQ